MANKIYDFLPGHLKNSELETIFETTLERVFSKGSMDKTIAFVGRKEKGINSKEDRYLTFPPHAHTRENYGLEPVYSSTGDKVYYEDLLNALFNKGALTNDHRRLFDTPKTTLNIPIDIDKFVNWSMYYFVEPSFDASITGSDYRHYVTIGREASNNWWSNNNEWYHYNDIKNLITDDNFHLIHQAKRPIIEFDSGLELTDPRVSETSWAFPEFKLYDADNNYTRDSKLFTYVQGDANLYNADTELLFTPLVKSGDYNSEYIFTIDMSDTESYKLNTDYKKLYISTVFNYRNFRQEFGRDPGTEITLSQAPKTDLTIDVYVEGIRQVEGYTIAGNVITFDEAPEGFVYVDVCTKSNVVTDGDKGFQRIHHSLEFNPDNESYENTNIEYSVWYEHFLRILETVISTGEANGDNNYRNIGDNSLKTRHNNLGSVLVKNSIDIKDGYFSITRDDYDPIKAFEFLSTVYQGYKNKLVTTIRDILDSTGSESKSDLVILEEAIRTISLSKKDSISVFDGLKMINFGELYSHYQEEEISIIALATEQFVPSSLGTISDDESVSIFKNGILLRHRLDYSISATGNEINFTDALSMADTVVVRKYSSCEETYIPPSATFLKINPAYMPQIGIPDSNYDTTVQFIQGHDGSLTPAFNDRTDNILLMFETHIWNRLENNVTRTNTDRYNYGLYSRASDDWDPSERKYTMYPFFKKWMIRNNIDDLSNTIYDPNDWKTWNYRTINSEASGHWRGVYQYAYNTDNPLVQPWKVIGLSQKPDNFDTTYGSDYTTVAFWNSLFTANNITNTPIPVDANGDLRTIDDAFFNNSITNAEIGIMDEDWEFGDGSPVEMAWRRSSELPFAEFLLAMLTKPFKIFYEYKDEIYQGVSIYNSREGYDTSSIASEKAQYEFKLGSKLGGFVNNFKLMAENTSLTNSKFTEIPKDNFDLVIHSGEPNRSEFFSAILIEKVSLDASYPTYDIAQTANYLQGDIVLNNADGKYYRRRYTGQSTKELNQTIVFDYSQWVMISQPKTRNFGYKVQGYDDINPTFFAMEWDKASGAKSFNTKGDRMNLNEWQEGEFYRLDSYIKYNGQPFVCLREHTSTTLFDDNVEDWKQVSEWPRENIVTANGYKKFQNDQVKSYNYGKVLTSIDEVAHLMLGYQEYLKLIGWGFTDQDDEGNVIDFEQLLYKFLEWSTESHTLGEFITLSPMLVTGSFTAPYGVATVARETHKNFYRVVDASGRLVPNTEIKFNTDGKTIHFNSNVPVYGMKIDIQDVEHAFVIDRVDSYGDIIYDPKLHNRNLRVKIDCNRTSNWDGTLTVDGYLTYRNELIPNFETVTSDTKFYRDTLVDQNLEIVNRLKETQIGFNKRDYLANHGVERESALDFYKGFLAHKGSNSAVNRIINNNGNFKDITHKDIWAYKVGEYGHLLTGYEAKKTINTVDIVSDPHTVMFNPIEVPFSKRALPKQFPIKTTGYVDSEDVNYTVKSEYDLENIKSNLLEGDVAWIQFDPNREWDVRRLSEVAEIAYVGETSDNQLYIGLTNQIDTTESVYIKIRNETIDPEIADYYYLVSNGTREVDGVTVYEYLVFELNYEPLIVEIDSSTSNSLFVPTSSQQGVEAIGTVSNPVIASGDTLVVAGETFTYTPGTGSVSSGILIGGQSATVDPSVSPGEQIRIIVYNNQGLIQNTNTVVTFTGTVATGPNSLTSNQGDQVTIDGTTLTVDFSSVQAISETSTVSESTSVTAGKTIIVDGTTKTFADISVTGTVSAPTIPQNKPFQINGTVLSLTSGDDVDAVITNINTNIVNVIASKTANDELVLDTTAGILEMSGSALQDLGLSTTTSFRESKFENIAVDLTTISGITATITTGGLLTIQSSNSSMTLAGTALTDIGMTAGTYNANSNPTAQSVANQINALNIVGVSASSVGGSIKIQSNNANLVITEVTAGAMGRLGFSNTTETINALDNIVNDINSQALGSLANTVASKEPTSQRQLQITSPQSSIVIENVNGNPLQDLGIVAGTYSNTTTTSSSANEFKDYINSQTNTFNVQVTSDGRMVFTSGNVSLSFSGTSQTMLDKIGLFRDYTSITSNANFKAMRWKSVRFTPNFQFETFDEFYADLGLNSPAIIWADKYLDDTWAVLQHTQTGALYIRHRQAETIEVDYFKRLILKDGQNFYNYQLYDPLNLKLPGTIIKNLDYITWEDPAGYDNNTDIDLWLDEKLGVTWWDTSLARYYRYNDYGYSNRVLKEEFVQRYWGKLVPGSEINVKKWTKSETLPEGVETFTSKVYFDTERNKSITEYFYWSEEGDEPTGGKTLSIAEIKMLIESGDINNKFIPISTDKILISNNAYIFENETVELTVEYEGQEEPGSQHADWCLIQDYQEEPFDYRIGNQMIDSLANIEFANTYAQRVTQAMLGDPNNAVIPAPLLDAINSVYGVNASIDDTVVTVNSKIVLASYLSFNITGNPNQAQVLISNQLPIVEGDVVRIYRVGPKPNNWFSDITRARENFATSANKILSSKHFTAQFPAYKDYIDPEDLAFSLGDWYLTEEYKDIKRFGYLSTTRLFDMLKLYRQDGIKSFKLELPTHNEFYVEHEGALRLVNSSKNALQLSYSDIAFPENSNQYTQYYENALGVQIKEFFEMLNSYDDAKYQNMIFFDMVNYMFTEKTHPDWIFKTSFIDLKLFNRNLRQYAIYQRDSYDDVIEYITEAKPYHTKIRETERIYGKEETANITASIDEKMEISLDFGNNSRYIIGDTIDGGDESVADQSNLPQIQDGTYDQGRLLRTRFIATAETGGFDTGLVTAKLLDSSIVFVDQFTDKNKTVHDKTTMFVYDMYGRGWIMDVKDESTVLSFDGTEMVVNQASVFKTASKTNRKLIALRNETTGNIEIMQYSKKDNTKLTISDRGLYTGISTGLGTTSKAYVLDTPKEIVLQEMDQ